MKLINFKKKNIKLLINEQQKSNENAKKLLNVQKKKKKNLNLNMLKIRNIVKLGIIVIIQQMNAHIDI